MQYLNSSLVTGELFLDLEMVLYNKTAPSLQTILSFDEIVEQVVLKDQLLMSASDHILILKNINRNEIENLGGNSNIDWEYEINNLGSANLNKPQFTNILADKKILILDTEQNEDSRFKKFGQEIFSEQWQRSWNLKNIGFGIEDSKLKNDYELAYLQGFNNSFISNPNRQFWLMWIKSLPDLGPDLKKSSNIDYMWLYNYFKQVEIYLNFSKAQGLEFSDNPFMQPFIALNSLPSQNFINIFYKNLKEIRNEELNHFFELQESWICYLPPLSAILLERCDKLEDIPYELVNLRKEFKNIRKSMQKFQIKFNDSKTIQDKYEIKKEFEESMNLFTQKVKNPKGRIIKTVLDFAVEQPGSAIKRDFTGPINLIVKKLAEYAYYKKIYPWVNSFADLYGESLQIREDKNLYEKLFGQIDFKSFKEFETFANNSNQLIKQK